MADPADIIDAALSSPAKVSTQAGTVEARSADDLIKLADYQAGLQAKRKARRGLMTSRVILPAAIGPTSTPSED